MADTPPQPKIEPQSQPWARWVTNSVQTLVSGLSGLRQSVTRENSSTASNLARLQDAINRLNTASETKDGYAALSPGSTPSSQTARTDYDVVTIALTKPSWATRATVFVSATMTARGTVNSPSDFIEIYARISGVNSRNFADSLTAPVMSPVYSGGVATGDLAYSQGQTAISVPFTRTMDVSGSTLDCSVRISKAFTGAGHGYTAAIGATVFWFAQ